MKKPVTLAFLLNQPRVNGYADAFSVQLVAVLEIDAEKKQSLVQLREGMYRRKVWVSFDQLVSASRREDMISKLSKNLDTLLGLAPNGALAVSTPGEVSIPSLPL